VKTTTRTLALSAVALALVAVPAAAFAGSTQHTDPGRDVQQVTVKGSHPTIRTVPAHRAGDIVHFRAAYTTKRLTESVRLRALTGKWFYEGRIETPKGRYDLNVLRDSHGTHAQLTKGKGELKTIDCSGLAEQVRAHARTVSVTVPASCLGDPSSVRVGAGMLSFAQGGKIIYADDALRKAGVKEHDFTLSKRLKP
jgi:hypothetical protein